MPKRYTYSIGLHKVFDTLDDLNAGNIKTEIIELVDNDSIIYITCDSSDLTIFGEPYHEGAQVIYTHKGVFTNTGKVDNISSYIPNDTTATDNQLTNKLYVDTQLSKVSTEHTIFVRNMTDSSVSISPNIFYIWGEMTELDITLADPADTTIYNEYMFQFTSGDTATTLTLPDDLTWYLDNNIILANRTYQVSIVNNLAVLGEF